jgi:hypothetical protein
MRRGTARNQIGRRPRSDSVDVTDERSLGDAAAAVEGVWAGHVLSNMGVSAPQGLITDKSDKDWQWSSR